jgi:hypothetical protein
LGQNGHFGVILGGPFLRSFQNWPCLRGKNGGSWPDRPKWPQKGVPKRGHFGVIFDPFFHFGPVYIGIPLVYGQDPQKGGSQKGSFWPKMVILGSFWGGSFLRAFQNGPCLRGKNGGFGPGPPKGPRKRGPKRGHFGCFGGPF